jgi:hypothetical protein
MDENREETEKRDKRLDNLKRDAGPGRPKGQRNYATIYREALVKLAEANGTDAETLETEILSKGIVNARKGDYAFYRDILDRLHGKPMQRTEITGEMTSKVISVDE